MTFLRQAALQMTGSCPAAISQLHMLLIMNNTTSNKIVMMYEAWALVFDGSITMEASLCLHFQPPLLVACSPIPTISLPFAAKNSIPHEPANPK